jgi:iron complex outermembrane receptor protein
VLGLSCASVRAQEPSDRPAKDLTELTPEQLANIEVTSVAKKPETRRRSPAAVYVLTRDEIRRSGVTTLVEALRLVPGVQVARIDSNKWAVGIRGFASRLSRSLLVMIDGRTVYAPLFAGTYWEVQQTLLDDVDRIEVIRGPGGALWGANSVNGVINIITRSSRETRGTFVTAGAGTDERGLVGLRYGGAAGDRFTYRVYARGFDRAPGFHETDDDFDGWHLGQGGFRLDWEPRSGDTASVQGDLYGGKTGQRTNITTLSPPSLQVVEDDADLSGANLLGRWRHVSSTGTDWALRAYYDRTDRREPTFDEGRDTIDLDLQRRAPYGKHDLIVGLGYRVSSGTVESVPTIEFVPARRTDQLFTGFVRDEVSLAQNELVLAMGSKFEHNDYSGFEFQPSAQLLWAPTSRQSLWALFARAVRTPSRIEHDLRLTALLDPTTPTFLRLVGDEGFRSESLLTAEVGYRAQPHRRVAVDAVLFRNDHRDLLSIEPAAPFREGSPPAQRLVVPFFIRNGVEGASYGLEIAADWTPLDWWRIGGSYSHLQFELKHSPESVDVNTPTTTNRSAPRHTILFQSRMDPWPSLSIDVTGRHVSALPAQRTGAYTSMDARLAWRPATGLELAVVGRDLLAPHHAEFGGSGGVVQVARAVYGALTWRR